MPGGEAEEQVCVRVRVRVCTWVYVGVHGCVRVCAYVFVCVYVISDEDKSSRLMRQEPVLPAGVGVCVYMCGVSDRYNYYTATNSTCSTAITTYLLLLTLPLLFPLLFPTIATTVTTYFQLPLSLLRLQRLIIAASTTSFEQS